MTSPPPGDLPLALTRALAQLARDVSAALTRFATTLDTGASGVDPFAGLSPRQRAIVELPDLARPEGLPVQQIADELSLGRRDATQELRRLADLGLVEQPPDQTMDRWRLPHPESL